jgi:hypothetical protein
MFDRFSIVPTELLSDGEALQEVLTLCSLVLLPPTKRAALFKVVTPLALQIPVLVAPSPEYAEVLKVAELFYDTTNVEALTAQLDELFQGREERERALALGQSALQQYLELPQEKLPILLAE